MNVFERNYWASYFDFINEFKKLSFHGVPLALICPYYVLINENDDLLKKIGSSSTVMNAKIVNEKQLQGLFDAQFTNFRKKEASNKGKVVFYDTVLRFPDGLMKQHFKPSDAVILKWNTNEFKRNTSSMISVDSLYRYQNIQEKTIKTYQSKATKLLNEAKNHPIYKNKMFRTKFLRQMPNLMRQILAAKNFFEKNQVSCLVLGTTNSSDTRILALVASSKGIPTVCLQHGVVMLEFGYLPKIATYQAVYGKSDIDWYQKKGVPITSLKSIGHPRFDELVKRPTLSKKAFNSHFKLDAKKKTILVVIHHIETEFPEAVLGELDKKGSFNIIIKQRNGKQRKSVQTIALQKRFPHLKFANDMHLYDILSNVDAVVSYESTIVLEAMLAGKPVYVWKLRSLTFSSTNYYNEISMYIHDDPQGLVNQLLAVMNAPRNKNWEKRRKTFLSTHYPHSGTSSENLKALIDSIKK